MTPHLDELLRDLGHLAAMIHNLDQARERWAIAYSGDSQQANQFALPATFTRAYSDGTTRLRQETPEFLYGMCFVHAYGLFENYVKSVLRAVLHAQPRILLTPDRQHRKDAEKKISYRDVVECLESPGRLLDLIIDRELNDLMYAPNSGQLRAIRERFGFSELDASLDPRIIQLNKIRNCIVHNHTRADDELARLSQGFYAATGRIHIDRNVVSRAITIFARFASAIDHIAERKFRLVPVVIQESRGKGD